MENPIATVKKSFPTGKFIIGTLIAFVVINAGLDFLANYVPGVGAQIAGFISRPFSFIKNKVSPPPSA
jgi:hypothetical protein